MIDKQVENYFLGIREELDYCREHSLESTYGRGVILALIAYEDSVDSNASLFECRQMPKNPESTKQFLNCLKEAGVFEFSMSDEDSAIRILHQLQDYGWVYDGLTTIYRAVPESYKRNAEAIRIVYRGEKENSNED